MKAKDLTIGDWVVGRSGEPFKIEFIDPDFLHWNEIQPIPLTPEILEKNGFVEWSDKCYRWEYADGIFINADFTAEEPWAHISNRCYFATPICRYVHELQHALRLCGIDKNIEL